MSRAAAYDAVFDAYFGRGASDERNRDAAARGRATPQPSASRYDSLPAPLREQVLDLEDEARAALHCARHDFTAAAPDVDVPQLRACIARINEAINHTLAARTLIRAELKRK